MTAVFFIRFSESFLPAQGRIFSQNKSPHKKLVLCTRNSTNWGLERTMWRLWYLEMLSTMSSWGGFPPLPPPPPRTASALPHHKPFCPCNEAILDTIQPFCTEKCIQLRPKIVKEMNQWSISGIFNYYSVRCTETMMAAASLMAVYQTCKQAFTSQLWFQFNFQVVLLWLKE